MTDTDDEASSGQYGQNDYPAYEEKIRSGAVPASRRSGRASSPRERIIEAYVTFWFARAAFQPETSIWTAAE